MKDLEKVIEIMYEAKAKIIEAIGTEFSIDVSIEGYGVDHPLAIQARELNWKPGRHEDTAWYEKSDEYIEVYVYVE